MAVPDSQQVLNSMLTQITKSTALTTDLLSGANTNVTSLQKTFGLMNDVLEVTKQNIPLMIKELKRLKGVERALFNLVLMVSITLGILMFLILFYVIRELKNLFKV